MKNGMNMNKSIHKSLTIKIIIEEEVLLIEDQEGEEVHIIKYIVVQEISSTMQTKDMNTKIK